MSQTIDLSEKKILVVEDDDMNYIYLNQIFKITKGNIIRAKNGTQAINFAKNERFDMILMDIQLPDISGIDVTKEIRKFDREIPIIAQTASRGPDEMDEIKECGTTAILCKPFHIEDFSSVLHQSLNL